MVDQHVWNDFRIRISILFSQCQKREDNNDPLFSMLQAVPQRKVQPMNKLRKAMLVGLCIAFVVCYFFLPELFTLSALDKPSLLILVVLGLLAFSVMFVCRRGLRKAKARLDKGIFPHRKKR